MQAVGLNPIVLGAAYDSTKDNKPYLIIVSRETYKPYCVRCKSQDCIHVNYLMSIEGQYDRYLGAMDRICPECKYYNSDHNAAYCIKCGSKLREVD